MNAYKNIDVVRIGGIYETKHERAIVNQDTVITNVPTIHSGSDWNVGNWTVP